MERVAQEDWVDRASRRLALYAAMFGATLAGQAIGIAVGLAVGRPAVWIPTAFSVVLESLAGARAGGARARGPIRGAAAMRLSIEYSLGLAAVTAPLVVWTMIADRSKGAGAGVAGWTVAHLGIVLAAAVVVTLVRGVLIRAFAPRTP